MLRVSSLYPQLVIMKSSDMTVVQTVIFAMLFILAGMVIISTTVVYSMYYNSVLRQRNLLGDILILNVCIAFILLYVRRIVDIYYGDSDTNIYWIIASQIITRYTYSLSEQGLCGTRYSDAANYKFE